MTRLGRLGFERYALTDVLPANLPEGGEAVEVKDVKIIHGNTEVSLAENTDYTLTRKDGARNRDHVYCAGYHDRGG